VFAPEQRREIDRTQNDCVWSNIVFVSLSQRLVRCHALLIDHVLGQLLSSALVGTLGPPFSIVDGTTHGCFFALCRFVRFVLVARHLGAAKIAGHNGHALERPVLLQTPPKALLATPLTRQAKARSFVHIELSERHLLVANGTSHEPMHALVAFMLVSRRKGEEGWRIVAERARALTCGA